MGKLGIDWLGVFDPWLHLATQEVTAMLLSENQLDEWVRAHAEDAQGVIVEATWRLIAAAAPKPKERRFPLGDSVGQHGRDGVLDVDLGLPPYFPDGRSIWEIGTGVNPQRKATEDYKSATKSTPQEERAQSALILVTPLSGRRGWDPHAMATWLTNRNARRQWREVRMIDGTRLIEWLHRFPSVELWLAQRILGINAPDIDTMDRRWELLRSYGFPPPLIPDVFVGNRDLARAKVGELLGGQTTRVRLETLYPDAVADFVTAHLAALDDESRVEASSRCLFVSTAEAWYRLCELDTPHVLVAEATLDLSGDDGTRLIQLAHRGGHSVVFGSLPGGIPDPSSVQLPIPRAEQVEAALKAAGYGEERARNLAGRTGGNLGSLKRVLQNLAAMPEWADGSEASNLAIAAALGSWNEQNQGDVELVEGIAGNSYGAWIDVIREQSFLAGAPLTQSDGIWRFGPRYEGWYALGPRLFRNQIERLQHGIVRALSEVDPRLDMAPEDRPFAAVRGVGLVYSEHLRRGLADTVALLGSHPDALRALPSGMASATAHSIVRELLDDADWRRWASLDRVLPLLAEAAPSAFLDAVERGIRESPNRFDALFASESSGMFGATYFSGTLWALETLAWSEEHVGRAVLALGQLAARDPGGTWSNRPSNSLTRMFLPWMPQTSGHGGHRIASLRALIEEQPAVGWKLLVSLLPGQTQVSHPTRRPTWRQWIPDDWSGHVLIQDYTDQVDQLSVMAVSMATNDPTKLVELIDHLEVLTPASRGELLKHVSGAMVAALPETDRTAIWKAMTSLVGRHRAFADADWAMDSHVVDEIAVIADRLAPQQPEVRLARLFTDRGIDLFEDRGNYQQQHEQLESRRDEAVRQILETGGIAAVRDFALTVGTPWRVGLGLGRIGADGTDSLLLPGSISPENAPLREFARGYVAGRFSAVGFGWADGLGIQGWSPGALAEFLAMLPFAPEAWERAERLLPNPCSYWATTPANPYGYEADYEPAIRRLVECGRPFAAIRCIYYELSTKGHLLPDSAIAALAEAVSSTESLDQMSQYEVVELIKALQAADDIGVDRLAQIEWAYLPLLDRHSGAKAVYLEARLAADADYFCDLIQLIFKSEKETRDEERDPKQAANGYRLLTDWSTPPGLSMGGQYDGRALRPWLERVSERSTMSGHRAIAMTMAGHALIHAPADPGGLWIDREVARCLNALDADDLRDGFRTAESNSRGAHFVDPTGQPERDLAAKYQARAEALDAEGFPRFAAVLRQLQESYLLQAERVKERDW